MSVTIDQILKLYVAGLLEGAGTSGDPIILKDLPANTVIGDLGGGTGAITLAQLKSAIGVLDSVLVDGVTITGDGVNTPLVSTATGGGTTIVGPYASDAEAEAAGVPLGGYYTLSENNIYGAPAGLVKQRNDIPFGNFSFDQLTELVLHLDASSLTGSEGDPIGLWEDESGRNNDAIQSTGASKPLLRLAAMNGLNALEFDGTDDGMAITSNPADFSPTPEGFSVFVVSDGMGTGNTGQRILQKGANAGPDDPRWWFNLMGLSVAATVVTYTALDTGPAIQSGIYNVSYQWNFLNGSMRTDDTAVTNGTEYGSGYYRPDTYFQGNADPLYIAQRDDGLFWTGNIMEVLIIARTVDPMERQAIEGYLAHKWGLEADLPSGHAYKASAPGPVVWNFAGKWTDLTLSDAPWDVHMGSVGIWPAPNGNLVYTHDFFGTGTSYNTMRTYTSSDGGSTWAMQSDTVGIYWPTLFIHNAELYAIGVSARFSSITLCKSTDNGASWSSPVTLLSGGSGSSNPPSYSTGACKVFFFGGYVYKAFEYSSVNVSFAQSMQLMVLRGDLSADLTLPGSWSQSTPWPFDQQWVTDANLFSGYSGDETSWPTYGPGYLEHQWFVKPGGGTAIVSRFNCAPLANIACWTDVDLTAWPDIASFTPTPISTPGSGFVRWPGGNVKFDHIDDRANSGYYVLFANPNTGSTDPAVEGTPDDDQRNILAMYKSTDLLAWTHVKDILTDDFYTGQDSVDRTGFQYPTALLAGNDILLAIRVAYVLGAFVEDPKTFHNSDRAVFKRIVNFRSLL